MLESARKPGAKILVSGGGRCNVTNARVTERDFWGGRAAIIRRVLRALTVDDTIAFFSSIGLTLHEEAGGKLFPDSNRARDVLDALLRQAGNVGVLMLADHRATDITKDQQGFRITTSQGEISSARVVLATGGQSLPKSGSDGAGYRFAERLGHTIVPTTPALAPLVLHEDDPLHKTLTGVSHDAELTIWIGGRVSIRLTGALLWTHFGISGPVVLNASRHWARATSARVSISFCPGSRFEDVDAQLTALIAKRPRASMPTLLAGFLPAAVAQQIVRCLSRDVDGASGRWSREDRRRLSHALVEWDLPVAGTRGYNFAEATAGGVDLGEIDPRTMQSRFCPGLYLVGEVLDVDGRIGGFNFQWAWSSGHVAGRALATDQR